MTGRAEYSGRDVVATAENPEAEELRWRDCNGRVAGAIGGVITGVADQVTLRSVIVLKCDGTMHHQDEHDIGV